MAVEGSVARQEIEADEARDRVASTIDALQERLSPRRFFGDAVDSIQSQGSELVDQAKAVVKDHPLAIGGIGLAIGLALFARSKLAHATVKLGDDYKGYTDYDDGYGDIAIPAQYPDEPDDDVAPRRPRALASRTADSVEGNPLVSIVLGLAAGAALGALFPSTERESRLFGDSADRISRALKAAAQTARSEFDANAVALASARDAASSAADRAKSSVRTIVTAATDELKSD